jgi:hypothetical protein
MPSDSQKKDKYSDSLRTLNETIKEQEIDDTILGFGRGWGDILLIENIRLEKRYRGYGISLLAVDLFVDKVAAATRYTGWRREGIVVVDASGLDSDLEPGPCQRELQEKLIRHWQLLGLRSLVPKRKLNSGKRCTFVGQWNALWLPKPDIATVVPHLFAPSAGCDESNGVPARSKRNHSPEAIVGPGSSRKQARAPGQTGQSRGPTSYSRSLAAYLRY